MRPAVRRQLLDINRAFYQTHGRSFAATRARPQPGVARVLSLIPPDASVLDVGCGHGLAAEALAARGHSAPYLGLDSSPDMIALAAARVGAPWAMFLPADVSESNWTDGLPEMAPRDYRWALAFSVLHHIPDAGLRRRLVRDIRRLQMEGDRAAISVWDFGQSERLRARIIPWEQVELDDSQVEPGDVLLDWRHEGHGLRYVHHFASDELRQLAATAGYHVEWEFRSDGEGGRLGLYQLWQVPAGSGVVESDPPG